MNAMADNGILYSEAILEILKLRARHQKFHNMC